MKIGIDISQTAFRGSGVDRYTRTLIDALLTYDKKNQYVFFYSSLRIPLDTSITSRVKKPHIVKAYRLPPTILSFLWNDIHRICIENFVGDVDIFMSSDWVEPPARNALKITTLHDMVVYRYPETAHPSSSIEIKNLTVAHNIVSQQKKRHYWVAKESTAVFADSESTKRDIINFLPINEKRIHTLYPGVEVKEVKKEGNQIRKKYNLHKPYVLTVGKREPRKNLDRLMQAFEKARLPDVELVIVGDKGWGADVQTKAMSQSLSMRFLGFVSDEDLTALYTNALFFVFPSLYEGFGYPILEAMGYRCPVATSNTSSLKEIARDYAVLFDPESIDSIRAAITQLGNDENLRKACAQKGYRRYQAFSKQKFAENFVRIVQTIYHDHRR